MPTPKIIHEPIKTPDVWDLVKTVFEPFVERTDEPVVTEGLHLEKPSFQTLKTILVRCVEVLPTSDTIERDLKFLRRIGL
jgi:hypothetical protein